MAELHLSARKVAAQKRLHLWVHMHEFVQPLCIRGCLWKCLHWRLMRIWVCTHTCVFTNILHECICIHVCPYSMQASVFLHVCVCMCVNIIFWMKSLYHLLLPAHPLYWEKNCVRECVRARVQAKMLHWPAYHCVCMQLPMCQLWNATVNETTVSPLHGAAAHIKPTHTHTLQPTFF